MDTCEIDAKTSWSGPIRGMLNVAAFYNDFSNQQLQISTISCSLVPPAMAALIPPATS